MSGAVLLTSTMVRNVRRHEGSNLQQQGYSGCTPYLASTSIELYVARAPMVVSNRSYAYSRDAMFESKSSNRALSPAVPAATAAYVGAALGSLDPRVSAAGSSAGGSSSSGVGPSKGDDL